MATAKQKAWRKKFARLYGKKKGRKAKKTSKARSPRIRRVKTTVRRRRSSARKSRPHKKYISISLINVGHMAMQYSNLTGKPLGSILDQLTAAIFNNQGDVFDIVMAEIMGAVTNVTDNTFQVAGKAALLAMFFGAVKSFVGHKKIFQIGKFRITV
jgi:hypothetical protein